MFRVLILVFSPLELLAFHDNGRFGVSSLCTSPDAWLDVSTPRKCGAHRIEPGACMSLRMAIVCDHPECEHTFVGEGVERQPCRYQARAEGWISTRNNGHRIIDLCPTHSRRD